MALEASEVGSSESDWLPIGYVVKPHGIRGELRLEIEIPWETLVGKVAQLRLTPRSGGDPWVTGVQGRVVHKGVLVRLDGIDSPETALCWRGAEVEIRRCHIPPCDEGEFYIAELTGVRVVDTAGAELGAMREVLDNAGQLLGVIVGADGAELLLPLVPETIHVFDRPARCLSVCVPAGLWDA